jgi:hypothetical protein
MKIAMVISSRGPGGAERVMTELANHLSVRGWDVSITTLQSSGTEDFYPLPTSVRRFHLANPPPAASTFGRLEANR